MSREGAPAAGEFAAGSSAAIRNPGSAHEAQDTHDTHGAQGTHEAHEAHRAHGAHEAHEAHEAHGAHEGHEGNHTHGKKKTKLKGHWNLGHENSSSMRQGVVQVLDEYDPYKAAMLEDITSDKNLSQHGSGRATKGTHHRKRAPKKVSFSHSTRNVTEKSLESSALSSEVTAPLTPASVLGSDETILSVKGSADNDDDDNEDNNYDDEIGNLSYNVMPKEVDEDGENGSGDFSDWRLLDNSHEMTTNFNETQKNFNEEATEGAAEATETQPQQQTDQPQPDQPQPDQPQPEQQQQPEEKKAEGEEEEEEDEILRKSSSVHRLGWSPPDVDPLLFYLQKPPMIHLKDFVQARGTKIAAWFVNVEVQVKLKARRRSMEKLGEDPSTIDPDKFRLDYWLTINQFMDAVARCPCNDAAVLKELGIHWTHGLVEAICREAAARADMKWVQFWNLNTPKGCINYLGLFFIGECASYQDIPAEMSESERRANLRKRAKDRVEIPLEVRQMIEYKKWWNKQVEKARDRIEQLRYEDWLRHKPDSDLEYDWDLTQPFEPYVPPAGEDWNMNLYYDACAVLGVIPCSPFLRQLHNTTCWMPHYTLGPIGAKAIAVPIFSNEEIIRLNISDNAIGPLGAKYIAQAMRENQTIEDLDVSDNRIQSEGAVIFCTVLLRNSFLVKINLSGNQIRDRDAPYIATVLTKNTTLTDLDLSHNELGDRAGAILGPAISRNKILHNLNLGWNHFKDPGSFFLLGGIRRNFKYLETVNLAFNGLATADATMIYEIIKRHRTLKEINISGNQFTPDDGVILAGALKGNNRLEVFRCGHNSIGHAAALSMLKAALEPTSALKILDLEKVDVFQDFVDTYENSMRSLDLTVTHGFVMGSFKMTGIYQRKRDFAREVVKVFNAENFRPVRVYMFNSKMKFIDFLKKYDKIGNLEAHVPELKVALQNPVDFEFEGDQLKMCLTALEDLAIKSTQLGFSSLRNITFNFSGFYVV